MLKVEIKGSWAKQLDHYLKQGGKTYRRRFLKHLRQVGRAIRKQQRADVRGSKGPNLRLRNLKGRKRKASQLVAAHAVVVKRVGGGKAPERLPPGIAQAFELFVGPTPGGDAFYGKFSELGTKARTTKAGLSRGMVKQMPWMRDAYAAVADEAEQIMGGAFAGFKVTGGAFPGRGAKFEADGGSL